MNRKRKAELSEDKKAIKYAIRASKKERLYRFIPRRHNAVECLKDVKDNLLNVWEYQNDPQDEGWEYKAWSPEGIMPLF